MIYKHIPGVQARAEFSNCKKFRYQLTLENTTRTKGDSLCVIMQNPSVANTEIADKSVQFLEKLIFEKEIELFENIKIITVVNQFAYIQTKDFIGASSKIGKANDSFIRQAIEDSDMVLIAWGKTNSYWARRNVIHDILKDYPKKRLLITKVHPSRGTYKDFIEPYSF